MASKTGPSGTSATGRGRPRTSYGPPERLQHDGTHWLVTGETQAQVRRVGPGLVPALENAIMVIEYLNAGRPASASLAELASALTISKSHCHSILKTLVSYDWLRFDERSKTYELSFGILASASRLLNVPALDIIRRGVAGLADQVGFPCVVSQPLADGSFMLIDKFSDPRLMEVSLPIGHRYPRDACAQMRAFLGWQSQERVAEWMRSWHAVRYTEQTPMTAEAVVDEINATRRRGYARSVGEFTEGLMALALPIYSRGGEPAFILNCSAPIEGLLQRENEIAAAMKQTVLAIHRDTLARVPGDFPA